MTSNTKKLSASSRPVILLRQWLSSGKLTGDATPVTVQAMSPLFSGYKLDNFRRAFNKLRKEIGGTKEPAICRDGDDSDPLERRCSEDVNEPSLKKQRLELFADADEDLDSEVEVMAESRNDFRSFKPTYMVSSWEERHTTTRRLSVAICLPSGVECGDYCVRVLSGGLCLEMKCICKCPVQFCNVELLHRKWLESDNDKLEPYHPKISGFDTFLKGLRRRNTDAVEQTARIQLPFAVESHVHEIHNMAWRDSTTRAVYVELRAAVEEYGVKTATVNFELFNNKTRIFFKFMQIRHFPRPSECTHYIHGFES